jgi:hypothetical protein
VADLSGKLQLKPGLTMCVINAPRTFHWDSLSERDPTKADAVLVFCAKAADLDAFAGPAVDAAREDKLTWIAFPKAGQLGTDLDRDALNTAMKGKGVQGVRVISLDDTWSAIRFRPDKRV